MLHAQKGVCICGILCCVVCVLGSGGCTPGVGQPYFMGITYVRESRREFYILLSRSWRQPLRGLAFGKVEEALKCLFSTRHTGAGSWGRPVMSARGELVVGWSMISVCFPPFNLAILSTTYDWGLASRFIDCMALDPLETGGRTLAVNNE